MDKTCGMIPTDEYIKIILTNGKIQKRTIYADENGEKFVFILGRFWELEYFKANWNIVQ